MSARLLAMVLVGSCLPATLAMAATGEVDSSCATQRHWLSEQLQQARLQGHQARQTQLNEQLQALTRRCGGLIELGKRDSFAAEQASQRVARREVLLRQALATGDAQLIELRKDELAKAREQLESSRRATDRQ
ncbi:MAG: DUF1090 family protein [Pseudomonas sp.]|uniref:DUF1090 domain-containing protein n=1 Tax=Stutzerimonas degradans TaxID=2968968 RepID=A0A8E2QCS9_9GAMM|nr:DUF1090 family protein [Stutzerimonas degradans]MCQ4275850.1 DUF1090 domain-containing protein [Stutzerimonas degradans]MEB2327587.1 DUF1090 family protein [Pseudomonas sp.]PNF75800.1 DUF1090 domain-containing protein [Stutzerimonas degradans]QPT20628.1 DUF1090 domain-containing protein [Stutzerimonas degradans]